MRRPTTQPQWLVGWVESFSYVGFKPDGRSRMEKIPFSVEMRVRNNKKSLPASKETHSFEISTNVLCASIGSPGWAEKFFSPSKVQSVDAWLERDKSPETGRWTHSARVINFARILFLCSRERFYEIKEGFHLFGDFVKKHVIKYQTVDWINKTGFVPNSRQNLRNKERWAAPTT